jgi:hypothetical protein
MIHTSTWTALRSPVFKRLWIANVISGTWVSAHDTAATWTMNMLASSPFFLSLMDDGGLASVFSVHFDPATVANILPKLTYTPQPDEGPVSIALESRIVSARRQEFVSLMREARLIFLRNGAPQLEIARGSYPLGHVLFRGDISVLE